jgi:ABC-type Na+ efflux pump permease subunit
MGRGDKQYLKLIVKEYSNYAFTTSACILCLFLFPIAVHASSTISRERERHTLDSLLTCPVMPVDLLAAKWVGTMLSLRFAWLWPGSVWLIGTALGNVPLHTFACQLIVWLIYAGSIACLGQWYSMICRSSTRALLYTLATVAVLFTGIIALPMDFQSTPASPGAFGLFREWLFRFQISLSPAFVFGRLIPVVTAPDVFDGMPAQAWEGPMILFSAAFWFVAGFLLWRRTVNLLRRQMCPSRSRGGNSG